MDDWEKYDTIKQRKDIRLRIRECCMHYPETLGLNLTKNHRKDYDGEIKLVPFGREILKISDEMFEEYLAEGTSCIVKLIAFVHRNKELPHNHNVCVKDNKLIVYNGDRWHAVEPEELHRLIFKCGLFLNKKRLPKSLSRLYAGRRGELRVHTCKAMKNERIVSRIIELLRVD